MQTDERGDWLSEHEGISKELPTHSTAEYQTEPHLTTQGNAASDGNPAGKLRKLNEHQLARGLGWFSIGLGLAEVLAPRKVAKLSGIGGDHTTLIRIFGLRELASGIGIFAQRRPTAALWSRVAGDALDLTGLGVALASPTSRKSRVAFATANVLGVTALDVLCATRMSTNGAAAQENWVDVKRSLVINSPRETVYQFCRNFQNLPKFMKHLESVEVLDAGRSHWVAKGPAGMKFQWDAEIVADQPNQLLVWQSVEGSDIENSGLVRFERAPGGRGTLLRVHMQYHPPGGALGTAIATLLGREPEQELQEDLRRFKQILEIGEVVVSDDTVQGTGLLEQRPANATESETSSNARGAASGA